MGPLLVVEIYGIRKVDVLVIFFLPVHSQPLSSALRPRSLTILVALAAPLVIWCPFGFGQWDTLPEITVRKELRALLFLLPDGFGFSVLEMAESINNYSIHLAAHQPRLHQ